MKPRTPKTGSSFFKRYDKPNYDPGTGQIISKVEGSPYIPKGKATRVRKSASSPPAPLDNSKTTSSRKREKPNYDPGTGQILSSVEGSPYIPKGRASAKPAETARNAPVAGPPGRILPGRGRK